MFAFICSQYLSYTTKEVQHSYMLATNVYIASYRNCCCICKFTLDSDQSVEAHSGASSGHESNASDGE